MLVQSLDNCSVISAINSVNIRHSLLLVGPSANSSSVLGGSLVDDLLLEDGWLGETKSDLVGGQLLVDVGNSVHLVLHKGLVQWVKENLLLSLSIEGDSHGLSGDVGWEALIKTHTVSLSYYHNFKRPSILSHSLKSWDLV